MAAEQLTLFAPRAAPYTCPRPGCGAVTYLGNPFCPTHGWHPEWRPRDTAITTTTREVG